MTNQERDSLKESVVDILASLNDAISLDTPSLWAVEGIENPEQFIRSLPLLLPSDAIIYLEGTSISSDVAEFYEAHRTNTPSRVVRDTVLPIPQRFHVVFSKELREGLARLAVLRRTEDLFDHIKAYRGNSLLFEFHDAFQGALLIADHVAEATIAEFCCNLGVRYSRGPNINKRAESLRRFLLMLENPDMLKKAKREPWWRAAWRRLTGK